MKILKLGLVYKASGKVSFCALKYVMLVTEFVCSTFPSFFLLPAVCRESCGREQSGS